jgi:hypothetical protein
MGTYAWLLWGQTLLALAALGLAGGWAVWPFRRPDRPYLWLGAPLAGIPALAGTVLALYYGCGLTFSASLLLGWLALSGATVVCLVRGGVRPASPRAVAVALAALGVGSAWGCYACNWTAMRAGEPTLAITDGSDMFGYAMVSDWLRVHPAAEPPRPDRLFEVLPYANLFVDRGRDVSFVLTGAAAELRSTTALFSYDWACGLALSAAVIGLAGLNARGPLGLALLLLTAGGSAWVAISRTGYMAKLVAYPGCLLLAALYLDAWARPSWARWIVPCLLGPAVALSLHPVVLLIVLGLLFGGLLPGLLLHRLFGRPAGADTPGGVGAPAQGPPGWRLFFRAVGLFVAIAGPAYVCRCLLSASGGIPLYPFAWDFIAPAALDLENPYFLPAGPGPGMRLVLAYLTVDFLLLLVAWRRRDVPAGACLLCSGVVPFAWLVGRTGVYACHGLLYPLAVMGAVRLLGVPGRGVAWHAKGAVVALLAMTLVALHAPGARRSARRYLVRTGILPIVVSRGEIEAIRDQIGDQTVDVSLHDFPDSLTVLSELACRNTPVLLRSPAWERTLKNWAIGVGCPLPTGLPPKGRFSLVEKEAYAPPGTVRYCGRRLKLCEDGKAIAFVGVHDAQVMVWDEQHRLGFYVGNRPTVVDIHNGTGKAADIHFLAEGRCGSAPGPDPSRRTLHFRLEDQEGSAVLGPSGWQADVPLRLPPGLHRLELWVEEPAAPAPPGQPVLLLLLTNLRLEPPPAVRQVVLRHRGPS